MAPKCPTGLPERYGEVFLDWNETPTVAQLNNALNQFGVYVHEDDTLDGSDMYGFIFVQGKVAHKKVMAAVHEARS